MMQMLAETDAPYKPLSGWSQACTELIEPCGCRAHWRRCSQCERATLSIHCRAEAYVLSYASVHIGVGHSGGTAAAVRRPLPPSHSQA